MTFYFLTTGKAFSYHSQDASNSSSDTDNADPHEVIVRCLQSHQEEHANEAGEIIILKSPRDQMRRSKLRAKQARADYRLHAGAKDGK